MFVVAIFGNPWDTQFLDNSIAVVSGFQWLLASSIWRSPLFLFPSYSAREPSESRQFHFLNYPSNQRVLTREFLKVAIDAQFRKISRRTATYFWFSPTVLSRKDWNSSRAFTQHLLAFAIPSKFLFYTQLYPPCSFFELDAPHFTRSLDVRDKNKILASTIPSISSGYSCFSRWSFSTHQPLSL